MWIGGGFHEEQAWDSLCSGHEYHPGEGAFGPNPDHYHHWVDTQGMLRETEKAWLVSYSGMSLWVAKSLVRKRDGGRMFVHMPTFMKILKSKQEEAKANEAHT